MKNAVVIKMLSARVAEGKPREVGEILKCSEHNANTLVINGWGVRVEDDELPTTDINPEEDSEDRAAIAELLDGTLDDITPVIAESDDVEFLLLIGEIEEEDQGRKGVLGAIDARLTELQG